MREGPFVVLTERFESFLWILSRVILEIFDGCPVSRGVRQFLFLRGTGGGVLWGPFLYSFLVGGVPV